MNKNSCPHKHHDQTSLLFDDLQLDGRYFKLKYFPISLTAFSLLGSAAAYRIRTSGSKCLFKVFLSNFPSGSLGEFAHVTPCHGRVTVRGHHMAFDRWS